MALRFNPLFPPALARWPFIPLPEYVPLPEALPRPTRLLFERAPSADCNVCNVSAIQCINNRPIRRQSHYPFDSGADSFLFGLFDRDGGLFCDGLCAR